MKKILFIILIVFFPKNIFSQISVSKSHKGPFSDFNKKEYDLIKSKKTIFVINDFEKSEFENMLKSFWTLNSYEVVDIKYFKENQSNYINDHNLIFEINGEVVTVSTRTMTTEYIHLYYQYYYPTDIKENKGDLVFKKDEVACIFLSADAKTLWDMIRNKTYDKLNEKVYNYELGYIKNYLQNIQKTLLDKWYIFAYADEYDKKELANLKTKTLYVPDYIKVKYNPFKGEDNQREDPSELFKKYKYNYEFIDSKKLNDMILNSTEDFYYLTFTRVNSQKFVTITNGKTGKFIYREYDILSYNINETDIRQINSKIK